MPNENKEEGVLSPLQPEEKDALNQARDAKCSELARFALETYTNQDVFMSEMPTAEEIKGSTELILADMVEKDVTLGDITYANKLTMQGIANAQISTFQKDALINRDVKYKEAVGAVLKIINEEKVPLFKLDEAGLKALYEGIGTKLIAKFNELGLDTMQVDFVFQIIQNLTQALGKNIEESVKTAKQNATNKLMGVEFEDEITVGKIIEVQKS